MKTVIIFIFIFFLHHTKRRQMYKSIRKRHFQYLGLNYVNKFRFTFVIFKKCCRYIHKNIITPKRGKKEDFELGEMKYNMCQRVSGILSLGCRRCIDLFLGGQRTVSIRSEDNEREHIILVFMFSG